MWCYKCSTRSLPIWPLPHPLHPWCWKARTTITGDQLQKTKGNQHQRICNEHQWKYIHIANSATVHEAVDVYNTILRQALDQHGPVKQKKIKVCHDLPWFNENIKEEIRLQHYKERLWRCNPNEYTQQAYYNQRRYVANLIYSTKRNFLRQKIQECSKDTKAIFKLTNKMMFCKVDLPLPATDNIKQLAQEFGNFFDAKITKIMNALVPTVPDQISGDYIEWDFQKENRLSIIWCRFLFLLIKSWSKLVISGTEHLVEL